MQRADSLAKPNSPQASASKGSFLGRGGRLLTAVAVAQPIADVIHEALGGGVVIDVPALWQKALDRVVSGMVKDGSISARPDQRLDWGAAVMPELDTVTFLSMADQAAESARAALSVTAMPIVDASSIDRAIGKANALNAALNRGVALGMVAGRPSGGRATSPVVAPVAVPYRAASHTRSTSVVRSSSRPGGTATSRRPIKGRAAGRSSSTRRSTRTNPHAAAGEISVRMRELLERGRQTSLNDRPVTG